MILLILSLLYVHVLSKVLECPTSNLGSLKFNTLNKTGQILLCVTRDNTRRCQTELLL